jgi:hypothetical protein
VAKRQQSERYKTEYKANNGSIFLVLEMSPKKKPPFQTSQIPTAKIFVMQSSAECGGLFHVLAICWPAPCVAQHSFQLITT